MSLLVPSALFELLVCNVQLLAQLTGDVDMQNVVCGIGPGDAVDLEAHVYMKACGWPADAQLHLLLNGVVDRLREQVLSHQPAD
jgi:hypothetical protein